MYGFCHGFLDRPGLCLVKRNPFLPSVPRHNCQQFEVKLDEWQKRYIYCLSHTRTHTLSHCLHSSPFDLCFSLLSKLSFPATITPLFFFFYFISFLFSLHLLSHFSYPPPHSYTLSPLSFGAMQWLHHHIRDTTAVANKISLFFSFSLF